MHHEMPEPVSSDEEEGDSNLTIDEYLIAAGGFGRYQFGLMWILGFGCYAGSIIQTIQLVFIEKKLELEMGPISDLAHSALFLGWGVLSPFLIGFSDTWGRKPVIMIAWFGIIFTSLFNSMCEHPYCFVVSRGVLGAFLGAEESVAYVLLVEFMPPQERGNVTIIISTLSSLTIIILSYCSYILSNYSWRVQLLIETIPTLVLLLFCSLFPAVLLESPRYLLETGSPSEALKVLQQVALTNRVVLPTMREKEYLVAAVVATKDKSSRFWMFFGKELRGKSFAVFFSWFTVTMTYYGLSFAVNDLVGSVYINMSLMALVELPAFPLCNFVINDPRCGRRGAQIFFFMVAGIALVSLAVFDESYSTFLALVGKFGSSAAFAVVYLYTAEIFPTTIRGTALGICNVFARTGGIVAPFLTEFALPVTFTCFGSACILAATSTYLFLPETLGKSLS